MEVEEIKLIYNGKEIAARDTDLSMPMCYRVEELYFGIIVNECYRYSSLLALQRTDVAIVDDDYVIVEYVLDMHPNTVVENKSATRAIILPPKYFDIEIGGKFEVIL